MCRGFIKEGVSPHFEAYYYQNLFEYCYDYFDEQQQIQIEE